MCAWWSALPGLARRGNLDPRRRGGIPRGRPSALASAAVARVVDGTAAGRSTAAAVVGLRRETYPTTAIEGWRSRGDPGRRSAQGCALRRTEAFTDHAHHVRRQ